MFVQIFLFMIIISMNNVLSFVAPNSKSCVKRHLFLKTDVPYEQPEGELLMKMVFSMKHDISPQDCLEELNQYLASFPFSAVLPVQPLTYRPRQNGNGLDLHFLRKKTKEKGSIDGGMLFLTSVSDDESFLILTCIRDAEGQTVSKVFTEGLVTKSLVSSILGEEDGPQGIRRDQLLEKISVESYNHKWM
jgi:hypothetical protein